MNKLDVKLLAFNDYDGEIGEELVNDGSYVCTNKEYIVQMFGLNKPFLNILANGIACPR